MSNKALMEKEQQDGGLALELMMSISSEVMLDVVLLSNDGGEIPASRFVLGARSPILQKMLFPRVLPVSSKVRLNYSANIVQTLVHYCRTNELGTVSWRSRDVASTREIVRLCHCAVSFQLKGLQDLAQKLTDSIIDANPHLACAIYDEAFISGKQVEPVKHIALNRIRQNPTGALLRGNDHGSPHSYVGGISSLGSDPLQEILGDPWLCTEEINLFRAVTQWADACSVSDDTYRKNKEAWATQLSVQRRRVTAKKIIEQCIDLSKIAPTDLMGIVSESGLVEEGEVSDAMIQVALRVEKEGVQVSKCRSMPKATHRLPLQPPECWNPPQTAHGLVIEEDTSVIADIYVDTSTSEAGSSNSYDTPRQNNKRRPKKQQPKAVTPDKKKKTPRFAYQDEDYTTNGACCGEPRHLGDSSAPHSNISDFSLFCQEKVDSFCVHPNISSSDTL